MNLEELINCYYDRLSGNDRQICSHILKNKKHCGNLTIDGLAAECHVSSTMLFRLAKKLSLSGFSELRAVMRLEAGNMPRKDHDLLTAVTSSYHKMIDDIGSLDCDRMFQRIFEAKRILVYGSGYAQARVASEWKRIFLPVRNKIYTMHGSDMVEPFLKLVSPGDYVILISLSGESEEAIRLANAQRLRQIPTLSVTRLSSNTLAALCEDHLYIHSIPIPVNYGTDFEISTPYFILLEILFLKYQNYLESLGNM